MDVFNPKILDASIRDVASCLNDMQKVDLLLFGLGCIPLPPLPPSSSSAPSTSLPPPYTTTTPNATGSTSGTTHTNTGSARAPAPASASASPTASYTSVGYGLSYTFNTYPSTSASASTSSSSAHSSYGYGYPGYAGYTPHSPAHTLLENGIASVLQVRALPAPTLAKARVLRARARMRVRVVVGGGTGGTGAPGYYGSSERREGREEEWVKGVRDDLHAALEAEPANTEARALLAALDAQSQPQPHLRSARQAEPEEEGARDTDRGQDDGREEDVDVDMDREPDVERDVEPLVQVPATRGPTDAEKILSPMTSPTLVHPPKSLASSSRPSTSTSTQPPASGSRTSRPHLPHASSSYSSTSAHASASTAASTSAAMPPPASPASTATPASFTVPRAPAPTPTSMPIPIPTVHKSPAVHIPPTRVSAEVWRLVGTHLARRDLANVLYLRHPLALVAAERLAADVEVWFGSAGESDGGSSWSGCAPRVRRRGSNHNLAEDGFGDYSDRDVDYDEGGSDREREGTRRRVQRVGVEDGDEDEQEERTDDARRATRTAHLLARVIRDPAFAARVKTLRVHFGPVASPASLRASTRTRGRGRGGKVEHASPGVAFQTGMLANALPSLVQLRNVHISGAVDAMMSVLRILQRRAPRLTGLSLTSPDSPPDLSFLDLRRLVHFSYTITGPNAANTAPASSSAVQRVLAGAQGTLRSVALLNPYAAVSYLQSQPPQGASSSSTYAYNSSPPTATAAASASYTGPIGHQQILHPQPPAQSSGGNNAASSTSTGPGGGGGGGHSRHGHSQQQGQYPQYPLTHPYAPSPHQHALPSHARSLAPHPHSAHAHSAQTHASAMMSVHALAGGSGGSSAGHVGPASSGIMQRDQPGYRPRIAPAPPSSSGYSGASGMSAGVHGRESAPVPVPPPVPVSLWVLPTGALSIGNLTKIHFAGAIAVGSRVFADILAHGRHLETLDIECAPLECTDAAQQFLDAASGAGSSSSFRSSSSSSDGPALPQLTHFSFSVSSLSRRYVDNSGSGTTALFPAIAEFLRGRRTLRTLALVVAPQTSAAVEAQMHTAVGFDASVWGVLPSLQGALRGVRMTYPADLSAGLAGWLVPRSVRALGIVMGESGPLKSGGSDGSWTPGAERERKSPGGGRDWEGRDRERERDRDERGEKQRASREAVQFLNALKSSMPPGLRFVSLPDTLLSLLHSSDRDPGSGVISSSTATATLVVEHGFPSVRVVRMGTSYWTVSRKSVHASAAHGYGSAAGAYSARDAGAPPSYESHIYDDRNPPSGATSRGEKEVLELEKWPRHRALYHTSEWLAWYGCEDAVVRDMSSFNV